jgi:hypothetical protein
MPLDFMPNALFSRTSAEKVVGQAYPGVADAKRVRRPSGLPAYLASLYEVPLLTREQEVWLFRKFNYLKYKAAMLREQKMNESVMVDCSHGNSLKDFRNQPMVARSVANQMADGCRVITSVMIESNLVEGNQKLPKDLSQLTRGQSITDACLGWNDTVETLDVLAEGVRKRRES